MKSNKYIYLNNLHELEENTLRIDKCGEIETNESSNLDFETYANIEIDKDLPNIQLDFNSYVSYLVTNECFTQNDEYEISEGKRFRILTKSRYLDFIKLSTFAEDLFPDDPIYHYQIPCINHIIDVISFEEPKITRIKRTYFTD